MNSDSGALHPQARQMVERIAEAGLAASYDAPLEQGRQIVVERARRFFGPSPNVARTEDRDLSCNQGTVPCRIHWPLEPKTHGGDAPPVIVYFHGGGWVLGSLDSHDHGARALCAGTGAIVVSVGYRRAPEHPFPAAAEDADAAVQWAETSAASIGGDPARIAVSGDSSGGNLAAVAANMARDRGSVALRLQILICPILDAPGDSLSYQEWADAPFLSAAGMRWFWTQYMSGQSDGAGDWRASPMAREDLSGLPPAIILAAGVDPLRDEARKYAARLTEAGVPNEFHLFERMAHGFFQAQGALDDARAAADLVSQAFGKYANGIETPA